MRRILTAATFFIAIVAMPASAFATNYLVYTGGLCMQRFAEGKGSGYIHDHPSYVEVEAWIDQRSDHNAAVQEFKREILDVYCTNGNTCRLYGYSNGATVITQALSVYNTGQYNVVYSLMNGSNEGGSELSENGWMAELFGGCDMADEIAPGDHRPTYNHHNGGTVYQLAGIDSFSFPQNVTSAFLPGEDDGAVAMHSGGGFSSTGSRNSACESGRWTNHYAVWWCYFDLDHYDLKMRGAKCLDPNHSCDWN